MDFSFVGYLALRHMGSQLLKGLNSQPLVQNHWTTKEVRVWYFRLHTHVQFFLTMSFVFLEFEHSRISC